MTTTEEKVRILHLVHGSPFTDYFRDLGRLHDPRYELWLGAIGEVPEKTRAELEAHNVRVVYFGPAQRTRYGMVFLRICAFLRRRRIHILNTHLFDPSVIGMLAGLTAPKVRRVLTRHHSDLHWQLGKRWHSLIDSGSARLAHGVIANSRWTARVLTEQESIDPSKVALIHTGIDYDTRHYADADEKQRTRAALGIDDGFLLTIAGRFHPAKGQETAIRALPEIEQRVGRPVHLLLAGRGPDEERLRRLAAEVPTSHIHFLGFRDDVDTLFSISDIVLVPSKEEAFGQVNLEAMAQQRVVVAARTGGIPEIVADGLTGLLFTAGSEEELCDAVTELLIDDDRRREMGKAGQERALQLFSAREMIRRYEAVYEEVLETGRTWG
jgi:glycosyltransferase involved in cell wall biosynthesis